MDAALGGLRIVDITTGPVGGLATTVLADFGADVVKVEPPMGDRFRGLPADEEHARIPRRESRLRVLEAASLGDFPLRDVE